MPAKVIKLDMAKVNKAFTQALPDYKASREAKPAKVLDSKTSAMMLEKMSLLGPIDNILVTFCGAWPKVRSMLNVALKFAAWVPGYGPQIDIAKAWLTAFNDEIVPMICESGKDA